MKRLLKDKRGEGFVDVCVLVLAIAMVLALVVRIAPVFVAKQNLDVFADELVRTAEINGQVGSATSAKAADLREQTGLDPNISWSDTGKIQLGNEVEVTLTTTVNIGLFGVLEVKKIREVLKSKSGQGVPMILAVVLCCLILACVTFEYMRLMIVAQGVRDSVQSAIVDVATENWDEAYAGLREGYSGGYQLAGSSWSQNVTSGNVYARLQNVLGVEYKDGQYVKYSGEDLEYRLYDLHLEVENAPLAPSVPDGITQLNVTGTITVDVPLSFGFGHLPPMQITMKLNAKYVPRF